MKLSLLFFTLIGIFDAANAQIGNLQIIDSSTQSAGVTEFAMADLDNDGNDDLITSFAGSNGKIGFYHNLGNGVFSNINVIEGFPQCNGVATGDFDGNGTEDIIAIGDINHKAKVYFNSGMTFTNSIVIDSNISLVVNDVVVADFDNNNSQDMVIIGQHSIDFYRNDGTGGFTIEEILTTSTSPMQLECLDMEKGDFDSDGDFDLVVGETAGVVVYENDGNGVFTPNYYSTVSEVITLVLPFDVDADGDLDIVAKSTIGPTRWFKNNGNGLFSFEADISNVDFISIEAIDYNNDGLLDLYTSYQNNISIFKNDNSHSFSDEVSVYSDANLIMGKVAKGNIDNANAMDYIWSGGNKTIAYHLNQNPLDLPENDQNFKIYPNPTSKQFSIPFRAEELFIYNISGQLKMHQTNVQRVDASDLDSGIYLVFVSRENRNPNKFCKLIVK